MKDTTDPNTANPSGSNAGKQLRATGMLQSESYTTNIPPRLPEGFSYRQASDTEEEPPTPIEDETATEETETATEALSTPLRTGETVNHAAGRVQKPQKPKRRTGARLKRIVWGFVLVVFILAMGAAFHFWAGIPESWRRDAPQPVVAADTVPRKQQPEPQPVDTTAQALSPEDSARIQDSVRHARWLYLQRHRRNAPQTEQTNETAPSAAAESANESTPHAAPHAADSVK